MDRVVTGTRNTTIAAMGISSVLSLLILLFGRHLMAIFTSTEELITISYNVMRILLVGYVAMEIIQCLSGVMRGAGDTMTPMWISLFNSVLMRVPLAYLLVWMTKTPDRPQGNFYMMGLSLMITWVSGAVLTLALYKRGKWKTKTITR